MFLRYVLEIVCLGLRFDEERKAKKCIERSSIYTSVPATQSPPTDDFCMARHQKISSDNKPHIFRPGSADAVT